MSLADGTCSHNNQMGYCPACVKGNSMRGLGQMNGSMGSDCPPGYYRLKVFGVDTGQCLPSSSTAIAAAQGGVLSSVGTGVASSPATATAVQGAAANAIGTKIVNFYKNQPVLAYGATAVIALFFVYGGMSFLRGK